MVFFCFLYKHFSSLEHCIKRRNFVVYVSASNLRPKNNSSEFGEYHFLKDIDTLNHSELARAAKRATKEGLHIPNVWDAITRRGLQIASTMTFTDISTILQSFAIARQARFDLFSKLSDHAVKLLSAEPLSSCTQSDIETVPIASNDILHLNPGKKQKSQDVQKESLLINKFDAVNYIRAAACLGLSDSQVLTLLVDHLFRNINLITPTDLSDLSAAYATLNLRNKDLFCLVAQNCETVIDALPAYVFDLPLNRLVATLAAFARVGMYHKPLIEAILSAAEAAPFSAPQIIIFLSALGRLCEKLPNTEIPNCVPAIKHFLIILKQASADLLLKDLIKIFSSLVHLRYYDSVFFSDTLLPSLTMAVDRRLNCRHQPEDYLVDFKLYSHLCELLMRLPPPTSNFIRELQQRAAFAAIDVLTAIFTKPQLKMTTTPLINLLRVLQASNTLTEETSRIIFIYIVQKIKHHSKNKPFTLPEPEKRVLQRVIDWAQQHIKKKESILYNKNMSDTIEEQCNNWNDKQSTSLFQQWISNVKTIQCYLNESTMYPVDSASSGGNTNDKKFIVSKNKSSGLHHFGKQDSNLSDTDTLSELPHPLNTANWNNSL